MDNRKLLIEMGRRINERRKHLNLSQDSLAEKADVSPQLLSTAERGAKALRPENLLKISVALGVSTDYLLTGKIIPNDKSLIMDKLSHIPSEKMRAIEKIIDQCIELCEK